MKLISKCWPFFWLGAGAITIFGDVFIRKDYWALLTPYNQQSLMTHETTHLRQQKDAGIIWFIKYIFSKKFRLAQEVEAYGAQAKMDIVKGFNKEDTIKRFAACLLSPTYFNMIDEAGAILALRTEVNKL